MSTPRADLSERVAALPGMHELLPALAGLAPTYLVGGGVRDLLLERPSLDVDLAVEGDAVELARMLAERLSGSLTIHDRFGTATVASAGRTLDLASTRRERYPHPGSLPQVEPAGLAEDLGRRDFTVNSMAISLTEPGAGTLHDPLGGRDDLEMGTIRVLHPGSFSDDPTRLLRALRYEARLGFALDPDTERLARQAADGGAFATVSGGRIRDELMELLGEPEAPVAVARLRDLGLADALSPDLDPDPDRVAAAALASAGTGADPALAALAAMGSGAPGALEDFVIHLSLGAARHQAVMRAAQRGPELAEAVRKALRNSTLHGLLAGEPPEALALALALGAPSQVVQRFLSDLRGASLEITGQDLLAAGVPRSPAIGTALDETLRRKLDGELSGRDAELRTALDLARGGS